MSLRARGEVVSRTPGLSPLIVENCYALGRLAAKPEADYILVFSSHSTPLVITYVHGLTLVGAWGDALSSCHQISREVVCLSGLEMKYTSRQLFFTNG